jgi:hypothetical protein
LETYLTIVAEKKRDRKKTKKKKRKHKHHNHNEEQDKNEKSESRQRRLSLPNQTNCRCIPWESHTAIKQTQKLRDWYQINQSIDRSIGLDQSRQQKSTATLNDPWATRLSNPDAA